MRFETVARNAVRHGLAAHGRHGGLPSQGWTFRPTAPNGPRGPTSAPTVAMVGAANKPCPLHAPALVESPVAAD